jgi:SAM-dependent methyltransferase
MDIFPTPRDSHTHSLMTLESLNEYTDFMDRLTTIFDMGCGHGHDLQWWANCSYLDDKGRLLPRNYKCLGIDTQQLITVADLPKNARYLNGDFEEYKVAINADLIWSHDSFRYATKPIETLRFWNSQINDNGAVILIVPQTVNMIYNKLSTRSFPGCYYNHTITSLMYMLAVNGFDCSDGMMMKRPNDPWLHIMAYKSEDIAPLDPKKTTWYHLAEMNLLPDSVVESIKKWGYVRQEEMVTTWLDKNWHMWSEV